jgi:hypothetical protein
VSRRLAARILAVAMLVAMLPSAAVAHVNQGDPSKVLLVNKVYVDCGPDAVPGKKIEGDLGSKITFKSVNPIDYVTVKSGKKAKVEWSAFWYENGKFWGTIQLNKDVSNYVVWTCP